MTYSEKHLGGENNLITWKHESLGHVIKPHGWVPCCVSCEAQRRAPPFSLLWCVCVVKCMLEGLLGPETQIQSPQRRGNLNGDHTVTQFDMRGHEGGGRDKKIGKYDKAT